MQASPYLLPLIVVTIISTVVTLLIWQRRQATGAMPLILLMLGLMVWSLAYFLSLASTTTAMRLFWANVTFIGIVLVPGSWLVFALAYSGQPTWLTRSRLLALLIMPLFTLLAVWTNAWHGLFRTAIYDVTLGNTQVLEADLGPLFWVHTAYSYALLLGGTVLLARSLFRIAPVYRRQAGGLIIGIVAPWIGNIVYLSGLSPFPHLDITPFALGISGVALTWDILRHSLFNLVPIARSSVFLSISDGVIVLDARSRVIDINSAGLRLINRTSDTVIGRSVREVFANRAELIERYGQITQVHEEFALEGDSNGRAFDIRIAPIYGRNGSLEGRVVVLHDITERRRAAAELQHRNQELVALAEENARLYRAVQEELAERKQAEVSLSLAKEAAEVASRAKTRFLRNMSHELRTPLTAILGYTDLLEVEARQNDQQRMLQDIKHIQTAGRHLVDLISDVLDYTRIEAEKLDLRLEEFSICAMVQPVVDTIGPLVEKHGNSLKVNCDQSLGVLYADHVRVRQILLNVLGNAAKFTHHGEVSLDVSATTMPDGQPGVSFAVSDTGIGMSPDQQQRLFKEFVQVDDSSTRRFDGSGLGLAISYRLCQLMGGTITVTSVAGRGSTFTIILPRVVQVAQESASDARDSATE